jgi:hypothetical protein
VSTNGSYSSAAYKWLARHGRAYGFVNDVRGEPWHWTFAVEFSLTRRRR